MTHLFPSYFLLTIDVEDWFQVENLRPWIPVSTWDSHDLRAERNVHRLLDLFDGESSAAVVQKGASWETAQNAGAPKAVQATFFILGWVAERLPHLVREITSRGHEVASHGYHHQMCSRLGDDELKKDLSDSRRLLEDIAGVPVGGFRAPNFSVDQRVLSAIQAAGYRYDSSFNSFSLHGRYGRISLDGAPRAGVARRVGDDFYEIPVSNLPLAWCLPGRYLHGNRGSEHLHLPWGGGSYFRLLPYWIFRRGIKAIIRNQGAHVFYLHPWEVDPEQPRVKAASLSARLKHYTNLDCMHSRLADMLAGFANCHFVTCRQYLDRNAAKSR